MEDLFYDKHYFEHYGGLGPYTHERWMPVFRQIAEGIVKQIQPKKVLEFGCAKGFLVEALRDSGIDAYGIDVSEHAISEVSKHIKEFCRVGSILDPLDEKYDLIICMEVVEHLPEPEGIKAIENMCSHADDIIFSSGSDYSHFDDTHVNVRQPEYWTKIFAENGFARDTDFDATFVAPHAMRFRRKRLGVTFICPGVGIYGGLKVIFEYCNHLARLGNNVNLVVLEGERPSWFDLSPRVRVIPNSWDQEAFEKSLPEADAIIATYWKTAPMVARVPDSKGVKYYLIQHYESMGMSKPEYTDFTYFLPLRKIVVSNWLRQIISDKTQEYVEVINPGLDHSQFHPVEGIRDRYDQKSFRIGMVYSPVPYKGLDHGSQAVNIVKESHPTAKLVLLSSELPDKRVQYDELWQAPPQDEIKHFYNSLDVFVSPSWYEGFGLPGLEAMACGIPLVTTDSGGNRDYAIDRETALVSSPGDPKLLAQSILKVLSDSDSISERLKKKGLETSAEFTWQRATGKFLRLLIDSGGFPYRLDGRLARLLLEDAVVAHKLFQNTTEQFEAQVVQLQNEVEERTAWALSLDSQVKELEKRIQEIYSKKTYRIYRFVRNLFKRSK